MVWAKIRIALISLTAVVILTYLFWPNFINLRGLIHQANILKDEIHRLEEQNRRLEKEIESLRNNPFYLEKVAREELGMSREGEVIYKFEE